MVLVEGENADGVTVDEENFGITDGEDPATFSAPDQVVAAILGTREGANEAGYQLLSTGVTWSDQHEAAELRDVLTARKVENVMLVSAFLAAAALAQSMGSTTGYSCTALLYIEPDSATLAVVDSTDGSIADVRRELLPDDDDQAVAKLIGLVSAAETLDDQPEALLVVGAGVDVPLIKPALEAATSLPLSVPERARHGAGPRCGAGVGECAVIRLVDRRAGLRAGSGHRFSERARARRRGIWPSPTHPQTPSRGRTRWPIAPLQTTRPRFSPKRVPTPTPTSTRKKTSRPACIPTSPRQRSNGRVARRSWRP